MYNDSLIHLSILHQWQLYFIHETFSVPLLLPFSRTICPQWAGAYFWLDELSKESKAHIYIPALKGLIDICLNLENKI